MEPPPFRSLIVQVGWRMCLLGFFSLCAGKVAGVGQRQRQDLSATYTMHNVRAAVEKRERSKPLADLDPTPAKVE